MTVMRNLLKLFVVLLIINGALMTVHASNANLPINAELGEILSIEILKPELSWDLDPADNPLVDDIAKVDGVFVSTNMEKTWTVKVEGKPLNDGTNELAFMTLTPYDQNWGKVFPVNMGDTDKLMWMANGKGVNNAALGFSQPISWEDIPGAYSTILTFTAGF
jgi:hypothetical protein